MRLCEPAVWENILWSNETKTHPSIHCCLLSTVSRSPLLFPKTIVTSLHIWQINSFDKLKDVELNL